MLGKVDFMTSGTNLPPYSNRGVGIQNLASLNSQVDWLTVTTREDAVGMEWFLAYKRYRDKGCTWKGRSPLGASLGLA